VKKNSKRAVASLDRRGQMSILSILPDEVKQKLLDGVVGVLVQQAERHGGDKLAATIGRLSSQSAFNNAFSTAMEHAVERFVAEYSDEDEDLVAAILADATFWQAKEIQPALILLISRPGAWLVDQQEIVVQHFMSVLPERRNRERVDKAVTFFLGCVVEELWTLPGAKEIRAIYDLQFQKIASEAARQQVALLEAQLQATTQLDSTVRQALLQLATILEQRLLNEHASQPTVPRPRVYHNLPYPDYVHFVGRQEELNWLRQRLSSQERAWQIVITGIGGVGKSTLALALAHMYRHRYEEMPQEERFEAVVWISAKEEILTIQGREKSALPTQIFRTLEDIYTTIAQTLEREDITRAIPEERDYLVQKVLRTQRTLLIVDNLESVTDERVKVFLRNVPLPTKCLITSREWVDVADIRKLAGLPKEEAQKMIAAEASARKVSLDEVQEEKLVERTAGLPLPIKLSVARMASGETFDQVMRWLGDATGDLPEYCVKGQVDIIVQRSTTTWKMLLACALFDKNVSIAGEVLGYVADLSLADRDDGIAMMQRLSLLNSNALGRFWVLPIVQVLIGTQLTTSEFSHNLIERWLSWWLDFTQHNTNTLAYQPGNIRTVSLDYPHIIHALRWCHQHQYWENVVQLAERTWSYPHILGLFTELAETLETAIYASQQLQDERQEGKFVRRLGLLLWSQGRYTETLIGYLARAEEIAYRYNDAVELGFVLNLRWDIIFSRGQFEEAKTISQKVLDIGNQENEVELKILSTEQLATLIAIEQQYNEALALLDTSDLWCREQNWPRKRAWNNHFRGSILIQRGETLAAEPFLMDSLEIASSWGERRLIARNKELLIQVYANTGRLPLAAYTAQETYDLYERLGMLGDAERVKNSNTNFSTNITQLPPSTL
jgi:tetratricopeptide (TPR) repeat protein/GTPase SAR1 family protein